MTLDEKKKIKKLKVDVDLESAEKRIEEWYRAQGVQPGQYKNYGTITGRYPETDD